MGSHRPGRGRPSSARPAGLSPLFPWVPFSFLFLSFSRCAPFFHFFFLCPYYLEKAMAPHSSTLAWKIPWTEEPGRLQSMGLLRVRHD